jgi:hypothetical protein
MNELITGKRRQLRQYLLIVAATVAFSVAVNAQSQGGRNGALLSPQRT